MRLVSKVCLASVLGAVLDLKDEVTRPNSALKWKFSATGSVAQLRLHPCSNGCSTRQCRPHNTVASEESLRMVFYLSCWGPNWSINKDSVQFSWKEVKQMGLRNLRCIEHWMNHESHLLCCSRKDSMMIQWGCRITLPCVFLSVWYIGSKCSLFI